MGETSISAEHLRRPLPWSPETLSIFLAASMGRLVSAILLGAAGEWPPSPDAAYSGAHCRPCAVGAVGTLHLDGHRPFSDVGGTRPHPLPLGHSALRPGAISLAATGPDRICCHNGRSELPPQTDFVGVGPALVAFSYVRWIAEAAEYLTQPVPYAVIKRDLPDAVEYLPAGFDTNRITYFPRKPDLSEWRDIRASDEVVADRSGEVTMRRAAFPIWRVMRGDEVVPYQGPVIHFHARPGHYRIERVAIWQEWAGLLVSMASLLVFAVVCAAWAPMACLRSRIFNWSGSAPKLR